jgi:hypothetical protein
MISEVNMELLEVVKRAYRKHVLLDDSIGWEELCEDLRDALANEIGDDEFCKFVDKYRNE